MADNSIALRAHAELLLCKVAAEPDDEDVGAAGAAGSSPYMRGWQWRALNQLEDESQSRWTPRQFTTESTPLHEMLASPGKQSLLTGLAGGGVGAGLGAAGGSLLGNTGLGAAAGGGIGALVAGLAGYVQRRNQNDRIVDALRRLPPGAVLRDYDALQKAEAGGATSQSATPSAATKTAASPWEAAYQRGRQATSRPTLGGHDYAESVRPSGGSTVHSPRVLTYAGGSGYGGAARIARSDQMLERAEILGRAGGAMGAPQPRPQPPSQASVMAAYPLNRPGMPGYAEMQARIARTPRDPVHAQLQQQQTQALLNDPRVNRPGPNEQIAAPHRRLADVRSQRIALQNTEPYIQRQLAIANSRGADAAGAATNWADSFRQSTLAAGAPNALPGAAPVGMGPAQPMTAGMAPPRPTMAFARPPMPRLPTDQERADRLIGQRSIAGAPSQAPVQRDFLSQPMFGSFGGQRLNQPAPRPAGLTAYSTPPMPRASLSPGPTGPPAGSPFNPGSMPVRPYGARSAVPQVRRTGVNDRQTPMPGSTFRSGLYKGGADLATRLGMAAAQTQLKS